MYLKIKKKRLNISFNFLLQANAPNQNTPAINLRVEKLFAWFIISVVCPRRNENNTVNNF